MTLAAHPGTARSGNLAGYAARGGDCATVAAREREVREADAEFLATVFLGDVAIRRCLVDATGAAAR